MKKLQLKLQQKRILQLKLLEKLQQKKQKNENDNDDESDGPPEEVNIQSSKVQFEEQE